MKKALLTLGLVGYGMVWIVQASPNLDRARQMERAGDALGARSLLARAVEAAPGDATALGEYAEFLDRYGDPECRNVYGELLAALQKTGDAARIPAVLRRLAVLDLLGGDRQAAIRDIGAYGAAGGQDLTVPAAWSAAPPGAGEGQVVTIPGPLRSFARMAAFSADTAPEEILPALARNVVTNGYQASSNTDALEQTEYLKLVHRYLSQARELEKLAGPGKAIEIGSCEAPNVGDLLRILGYRMRGGCGSALVLETVNATRAFLTSDSGFPLVEFEQALRSNRPFRYDYQPTSAPVLFGADFWLGSKDAGEGDFIDVFLSDPSLCRLYVGLAKLDWGTADALRKSVSLTRLKAYAHVLDFFGGMFEIRNGKAMVPGGAPSSPAWAEMVGVPPDRGAAFFERLLARDDGWMASYFDALSRIERPVLDYLAQPARLKRFYAALRGRITSPGPARPVFRSNADMLLLTTRLYLEADGRPHIPGGLDVWKSLFTNHPPDKFDPRIARSAATWKEPDDVIEALFGLARKPVDNLPLKIFMTLSDLDRPRAAPLQPATVERLVRRYKEFGPQYAIFNDAPGLADKSILEFLDTAETAVRVKDPLLFSDTAGTMQALVGLWGILVREGIIPAPQADSVFAGLLAPFSAVRSELELFDAGYKGVKLLLQAGGAPSGEAAQERMLDLLAGNVRQPDEEVHSQVVQEIIRILEAQRIVSLDTLFAVADHLDGLARGEKLDPALIGRLSSRISEVPLPRASLSSAEKNAMSHGYWSERHLEDQRKMNLRTAIQRAAGDKEKIRAIRAQLAPVLRDTLMAFNYAHYAPPGAQILYTNPVFVRTHDFLGALGDNAHAWASTGVSGSGWPNSVGGRLTGSLAGLPYALAEAEQNFLVPSRVQALIWSDLVPQLLVSAKIPSWWRVTPAQIHWVALHMRYAESLFAAAAFDAPLRQQVLDAFSRRASPFRASQVAHLLEQGEAKAALEKITPAELFAIGGEMAERGHEDSGPCRGEIRRLAAEVPDEVSYRVISHAFGTPKPMLANSYGPELLNLRTFPALMGYSSRILAESWESSILFWAGLADEIHLTPAELNVRIPEWTQKLVERIFASHLEDWPALLRSLRMVGDDVRARSRSQWAEQKASLR